MPAPVTGALPRRMRAVRLKCVERQAAKYVAGLEMAVFTPSVQA